jgi:HEAT repeat protein
MRKTQQKAACMVEVAWCLVVGVSLLLSLPGAATAQINSNQMRQRYNKHTKGTSIEDFVKQLSSDDPMKRLEGVKSLGSTKEPKAVDYLIQALGDPDIRVKAKAIEVLGDMRANEATPVLVQYLFLRTTDAGMKQLILASLGKIGDTSAARPLIEFLQRDLDRATRGTAIFALGEIGAPESIEPLAEIARTDTDPTLRRLANEAKSKVEAHQAVMKSQVKGPSETFLKPEGPRPAQQ